MATKATKKNTPKTSSSNKEFALNLFYAAGGIFLTSSAIICLIQGHPFLTIFNLIPIAMFIFSSPKKNNEPKNRDGS